MVKEITPPEAWNILQSNPRAVLLDVRSGMEYEYVGHPVGALHIPWKDAPDWQVDPAFVARVRSALAAVKGDGAVEDLTILAMCRSGARSMAAAEALQAEGFRQVINIAEGFEGDKDEHKHRGTINGWRFHGLPWEQG